MSTTHDENGFYYAIADYIFKNLLFGENTELTKWFLSKILGITVFEVELKNTIFPKETQDSKNQNLDIVIVVNNHILLDIEANSSYYESLHTRNFGYAMTLYRRYIVDAKDSEISNVILVDFTRGLNNNYTRVNNKSHLQTVDHVKYVQNFETLTFNLDKVEDYWYHKDTEKICEYFYLIMLVLNEEDLNSLLKKSGISEIDKNYLQEFIEELRKMVRRFGCNCRTRDRLV